MGNTLPSNPTRQHYIKYASRLEKSNPNRAIEIYEDVVRDLRLEKNWQELVDILSKLANLQLDGEKAKTLLDIANTYKKIDSIDLYIQYLEKAISQYQSCGAFSSCAKCLVLIAEEYESIVDYKKAIDYYTRAVDYYEMTDMESTKNMYVIKLATLSALDSYTLENAISLFEKIAQTYANNKKTLYSAPQYFFKAALCRIAKKDLEEARKVIDSYSVDYPIFASRRESKFLDNILSALEKGDINSFTAYTVDYNEEGSIDGWTTSMLLNIKRNFSETDLR